MAMTILISVTSLLFAYAVSLPIGIYSALHQYSLADNVFTVIGLLGLATPNFLLALILLFVSVVVFGASGVGGLFSPEYMAEPWSIAKVFDLLRHLWVPVVVVGTAGTAGNIRIMRSKMLDTMGEPYIETARMKGLKERRVVLSHGLRVAINPMITRVGMQFPEIISGTVITGIVLGLPTVGPLFYQSLTEQDMYMAGSILMVLCGALIIGNFVADLALAWIDPRIKYE